MPRVSKALYVIPIIAAPLAIALPTIGQVIGRDEDGPLAFLGAQLILAVWVFTAITQLVLVYKAWAAINDGHSRTTPGRAVGFLFIPIYNIYWLINITRGFAIDYNQFAVRHDLRAPSLDPGFFTTRALLLLLLPLGAVDCVLSLVILLFNTVIGAVVTAQVCGAINAVARATTPDRPEASV